MDLFVQLVVLACAPLLALLIVGLTQGGPSQDLGLKLLVLVSTLAGGDLLCESVVSVRAVDIDSVGVKFRYLFNSEFGKWSDLFASSEEARHSMWVVGRVTKGTPHGRRGHWITVEQARAILDYPSGRDWNLSPGVAASLGLVVQQGSFKPTFESVTWLPKNGFTWLEKLALVSGLVLIAVGLGIIVWVPTLHPDHATPASDVVGILALFVFGAVLGFMLFWLRVPRAVGISPDGIILAYPFRNVRYPWNDLMKVLEVSHDMVTFNPLSYDPRRQVGSDMISYAQARTILADPRCPTVWMRDDQRRLIMEGQPVASPR